MSAVALVGPSFLGLLDAALVLIKRTYQPSKLRRNRKYGFLARLASKAGRDTIARRVAKGRHKVSAACVAVSDDWTTASRT